MKSRSEIEPPPTNRLDSIWKKIQVHLESQQNRIYEEIKNYPKPIPACDVQFNYLLEQRDSIATEMDRLQQTMQTGRESKDPNPLVAELVNACQYLSHEVKQQLFQELKV
jgi:hypothetical protein